MGHYTVLIMLDRYITQIVTIGERYHPIAVIGMGFCAFFFCMLLVLGRRPTASDTDVGLDFREWNLQIDPITSSEQTAHYWPLLRELRSSLGANSHFRVLYGTTEPCKKNQGDVAVVLRPKEQNAGADSYVPTVAAFLMRNREGYRQVVDVRMNSGFPDLSTSYEKRWVIKNYTSGEKLEVIALIAVTSGEKLAQIRSLPATLLFYSEIKKFER
jgi:hypothetical protein